MYFRDTANLTKECINIGNFEKKQYFHYCVLMFDNIGDIREQGNIIEESINTKNFILLPRASFYKTVERNENDLFFTSLLLFYTDEPIKEDCSILKEMRILLEQNNNIYIQHYFSINSGKKKIYFDGKNLCQNFNDANGSFSYLIFHKYINNSFVYYISSHVSFYETVLQLENIVDNITFDLLFTGRLSSDYNIAYTFGRLKVKSFKIKNGNIFISNVKDMIDYDDINLRNGKYVYFLNFLPDWRYKSKQNITNYSNMFLYFIDFIPEKLLTVKSGNIYFNDIKINNKNILVCPEDRDLRNKIFKNFFTNGSVYSNNLWLSDKSNLEDIIKSFDEKRVEKAKKDFINRKRELRYYLYNSYKEKSGLLDELELLEKKVNNFIPIPKVILPKEKEILSIPLYDLCDFIREENDEYLLEIGDEA